MLTGLLAQAAAHPASDVMSMLDVVLFCAAVVGVIGLGIYKARPKKEEKEKSDGKDSSAADYFLAGRGLSWWLIGFSLIAANISTEQFVGMSGQAADWLGLAIASYEWLAAIVLVFVAFFFLPKLLRCGVYTIPEFLESRYNPLARTIMAISTIFILVGVPTAGVIYSGAKVIAVFFFGQQGVLGIDFGSIASLGIDSNILVGCFIIAFCGAIYVYVGGLKACAWTDLIWGAGLILGGGVVAFLALRALGAAEASHLIQSASANSPVATGAEQLAPNGGIASGWERFLQLNAGAAQDGVNTSGGKLHMIRPQSDSVIPWTALCLGLWIPNFFYWGLNQYIMQRTLAAKSLSEGQTGIVFAAFLKLLIPFVVIIPGILAYNLYRGDLKQEAANKNAIALQTIDDDPALKARTIYYVTDGYLLENAAQGKIFIEHNMNVLNVPAEKRSEMRTAFAELEADIANDATTMAQRSEYVGKVAALNQEFVEAQGDNYAKTPDSIISNGPFVLESWDYANNVTVVKNDLYWNAENIDIDELNFVTVADQQTAAMMYSSGDVDFAEISGALIDQYESDPGFSKVLEVHVAYLMANNSVPALQNNNFRKALALSYSKEDIADKVMKNGAMAANYLVGWKCGIGPDGKDFRETSPEFLNYNPELAREFGLGNCLRLGPGELKTGGARRDSLLADAVESVIAAMYLDSGEEFDTVRQIVLSWFENRLKTINPKINQKDPKSSLQELLQSQHKPLPQYKVVNISGTDNDQVFTVEVCVEGVSEKFSGQGSSKRRAEQVAAQELLDFLKGK